MKVKKSFWAFLLACCLLLPACGGSGGASGGEGTSGSFVDVTQSSVKNDYDGEHVDANDDGTCDKCSESVLVKFDVLAMNDLHGKFLDTTAQPGVDEISTYIENVRKANPNTILLSSGDMWQGSPESNLTKGAIITEWMNEMGFASMTLGNHEYDWGEAAIEANSKIAQFPFLGLNVYDKETNQLADYCKPSTMVEMGGVKIGIIGAEGNVHSSISTDKGEGVTFKTDYDLTNLVRKESQKLRAEGADCIIYSLHDGTTSDYNHYDERLSQEGYVDIVFEAHTHANYVKQDKYGIYHVQGGGDNANGIISHAQINVNYVNATASVPQAPKNITKNDHYKLDDHKVVGELQKKYETEIAPAYEVLGNNPVAKQKAQILSVSAQTYYEAGAKKWADKPIVCGGGFMNLRSPGYLKQGVITYGDIINLMPFDNELVLCTVKGITLLNNFIQNGSYYLAYSEYGQQLKNDPSLIEMGEDYYVVTDRYSSTYGPNKMTEIEWYDTTTFQRDLYADYLKKTLSSVSSEGETETLTIAEALAKGSALQPNASTAKTYRVEGEIVDIEPFNASHGKQFGNMTIQSMDGSRLYVYGTVNSSGTSFNDMSEAERPKVGDYITLEQKITRYVKYEDGNVVKDIVEMNDAVILSFVSFSTIPQLNAIGEGLGANQTSQTNYAVRGEVLSLSTSNGKTQVTIQDEQGETLELYDLKCGEFTLTKGQEILVVGAMHKYVGNSTTVEMKGATVKEIQ